MCFRNEIWVFAHSKDSEVIVGALEVGESTGGKGVHGSPVDMQKILASLWTSAGGCGACGS